MSSHEQLGLGIIPEEAPKPAFDTDAAAKHIGAHASSHPYRSQESREAAIADRKAATHTPDTLPDELVDAAAQVEQHFAETAPGGRPLTSEEAIQAARNVVDAANAGTTPRHFRDVNLGLHELKRGRL